MDERALIAAAVVAVLVFYIPFLFILMKGLAAKAGRRVFYRSIKRIFEREPDDSRAIDDISTVHRKIADSNQEFYKKYRTSVDICEDLLARITGYTPFVFRLHYALQFTNEEVSRLSEIIRVIQNEKPFIALSPKYGNQLEMLRLAYNARDVEMGLSGLRQLAKDIKGLESTIENKDKMNRVAMLVSVIGVIMTVVFGAASVVQVFA